MAKDLYFLSIIADALRQPEPKAALRAAIEEIITLGQRPEYEQGFLQFQRFMAEVKGNSETEKLSKKPLDIVSDEIRYLSLQVASDLLEENPKEVQAVLDLIASQPRWQEEFEKLRKETEKSKMPRRTPEIIIERNEQPIGSISCEQLPVTKEIRNVKPAHYAARMDTGRIIWQGELTEKELIWSIAFPGEALELAADTGEPAARMTQEITLLNGELVIRIFPGAESGRLELRIGASKLG
jgi:hypothetical protein